MEDKRQFNRWFREGDDQVVLSSSGSSQDIARIVDVSVGGMRVTLHNKVNVGEEIYGQFNLLQFPYYVHGTVNRVFPSGKEWEIAIAFDKVSAIPIN